ncbi:WW domain-binding protein 2 isoform X2 [Anthonomus grandis grandis]|uniref:WW domain-binding protein 2 isoform X2 n=1 Tax=Anthonomus grandis grandis TaxID=2921223 RepID=UPI00216586BB|nr:WW domain-binding protein 2 isoform X2 [Anthonomus grandis grandis]
MSLNTAHVNNGVLIHAGEQILLFSDHVNMEWSGNDATAFRGKKNGRIFLTTHRVIFNNNHSGDEMQSFSLPFVTLSDVQIEQPVFGANYIKGKVRAQPNGNWVGEAKFKMFFTHGGAIEFGQALLKAAHYAINEDLSGLRNGPMETRETPPPYMPPQQQWYAAPPPAYAPPPQGYYGWVPPTNVFPQQPPRDGVFMTDSPPPYPGINPGGAANGYGPPPGYGGAAGGGFAPPGPSAGWVGMPGADAKAAEAARSAGATQSAYYDPDRPHTAYVPPPAYYENPPSYNQAMHKKKD